MKVTEIRSRVIGVDARPQYATQPGGPQPGNPEQWEYLLTTVETDEGITGESMLWGTNREGRGLGYLVRDVFREQVLGKDPLAVEARWQELRDFNRSTAFVCSWEMRDSVTPRTSPISRSVRFS